MNLIATANRWNDDTAKRLLALQILEGHPNDVGGLLYVNKGFSEPASGTRLVDVFLAAYYSPQSRYYGQAFLLERALAAIDHVLLNMHEDGTLDLLETNFHDATANAFCTQVLGYTHRLIKQFSRHTPIEDTIQEKILLFLKNSARAMLTGGFHTPNHRWVTASALALCYKELGDEACRALMQEYLDEGIDNDEEGEYTERSVAIYDIACDQSLLIILREMDMPALIEPVLRNLEKLPYYIEPDGTIATLNSRRQDFGKNLYAYPYLLNCLFALRVPHDPADARYLRLMGLTDYLYKQYLEQESTIVMPPDASQFLTLFMLNPRAGGGRLSRRAYVHGIQKAVPAGGRGACAHGQGRADFGAGTPGVLQAPGRRSHADAAHGVHLLCCGAAAKHRYHTPLKTAGVCSA